MKLINQQGRESKTLGKLSLSPLNDSSPLLISGGSLLGTTDFPLLDLAATWNNSGGTFTGIKVNVTNTSSNAASKLLDLQVGGVSKLYVAPTGAVIGPGSNFLLGYDGYGYFTNLNVGSDKIQMFSDGSANLASGKFLVGTDGGITLASLTSDPSSATGKVWFRSDLKLLKYYDGSAVQNLDGVAQLAAIDSNGRVFSSRLPNMGTSITTQSDVAYFVYIGRVTQDITVKYVELLVTSAVTATQVAEAGLFSSANPPNKGTQSLSKIGTPSNSLDSLLTTGVKRTSALNQLVTKGTYLWAGIRTAFTGSPANQPVISGLCADFGEGRYVATSSGAGALTGSGPWSGALIAASTYANTAQAPDLRVVLD